MLKPKSKDKEREAYRTIHKIIKLLSHPDEDTPRFILKKKLRGIVGRCEYESITLGCFYDVIPTLIHELIHLIYDEWTETEVLKHERHIKHYIKIKDVVKILKLFANLL